MGLLDHLPKQFWQRVRRLVRHAFPRTSSRGRPRAPLASTLRGILYRLRTGCPWAALPAIYGASSTVHGWFQRLTRAGIWEKLWVLYLSHARARRSKQAHERRESLLVDASLIKAPSGGSVTGPSPVHRGRLGSKRSVITDSRGRPVAILLAPANRHDSSIFEATLKSCIIPLKGSILIADKGYVGRPAQRSAQTYGCRLIVPGKGQPTPRHHRRLLHGRWPVERCFAWFNQFRALATRYERHARNYQGLLELAAALIWCRSLL